MVMGPSNVSTGISGLLRSLAEGAALRAPDAPEHGPLASSEQSLTALLDLGGTVRLADHLNTRRGKALGGRNAPVSPLRESLAKKVGDVRDEMDKSFQSPFSGRRALPTAEVVDRLLTERDAFTSRDREAISEVAKILTAQARERYDHQFAKCRQRIRWIRTDVSAELRALGPRAAMLEVFDAVLGRSLEGGFHKLLGDVAARLDDIFVARLRDAVLALPEGATSVAPLYASDGAMTRYADELGALLRLLLENELDAVLALVDSAYALRNQEALA